MSEDIVLDCKIANVTTVWPKNQLKINLAATLEAAEYEAAELGELARMDSPITVKIHERVKPEDTALSLVCSVESVKTDHKTETVTVSLATHATLESAGQAEFLGILAYRDVDATARFTRRQMKMDLPESITADAKVLHDMGATFSTADPETGEIKELEDAGTPSDPLLEQAADIARDNIDVNISMLQRKLRIGYPRAARLFDILNANGFISVAGMPRSDNREVSPEEEPVV